MRRRLDTYGHGSSPGRASFCRGERPAPVRFLQFDGDDEYIASMVVGTVLTHPASRELMFCSHPCSKELSWDSRRARDPARSSREARVWIMDDHRSLPGALPA
jgi:hypothetical protein